MAYQPGPPCASEPGGDCPCGQNKEATASHSCPVCTATPGGSCGSGSCSQNSVVLSSGAFKFDLSLLSLPGLNGPGWAFDLSYLSNNQVNGILGPGFNYPHNLSLQELSGGAIRLVTGHNTWEQFNRVTALPPTYQAASDNNSRAVLTRAGGGAADEFTLTSASGTVSKFFGFDSAIATPGRVKSITDRFGSVQSYVWQRIGSVDQVTSVTDDYGRTIEFRYFCSDQGNLLREVEDFLGRKLNFQYDSGNRLSAVVTPSIERGVAGNTFPGGTAYVFQYDANNSRPERRNDLVRIWYPNQVAPYLDTATRTVDVAKVYALATPRYIVAYSQDPTDADQYGRVGSETVGDPTNGVGGTYRYQYTVIGLPANLIDPTDPIVFRCIVTDRNENQIVYDFNGRQMPSRVERIRSRSKINIPSFAQFPSYVTWSRFNQNNQRLLVVFPQGNSVEYEYETGTVTGIGAFNRRQGLKLRETARPGNTLGIPARSGSNGQTELTRRFFYEPLFAQRTATIERRGNPIAAGNVYFVPQNGGTTPTNTDRSRFATITYYDYQKNQKATVQNDANLQALLGLTSAQIGLLIDFVDNQMKNTGGSGGLPAGFEMNLGDINGDGTGNGATSGLVASNPLGNVVKVRHPSVRLIGTTAITTQVREEIFTTNTRGQVTTHTDPEGNLSVFTRYPFSDPEGDGKFIAPGLGNKQYGNLRETHVDADPNDVLSLVGSDGDLIDFIPGKISRTNTPGIYQKLVTRYEGSGGGTGGCSSCGAYDSLGNPLAVTDPRGFTIRYERNELGETFRTTSPAPYLYQIENFFDANRNLIRIDTEDKQVAFDSEDPTSACYGTFTPTGSGTTAQIPMKAGPGGAIRPGWFTNLNAFDLLDNKLEEDLDATGSNPSSLVTTYEYDPNQNLVRTTKPDGNIEECDYDERNLRIAMRRGNAPDQPAITVMAYDGNGNPLQEIGPAQRGASGNWQTVTIEDAFRGGVALTHTGDFVLENTYDGFDRVIKATDAVGGVLDTGNGGSLPIPISIQMVVSSSEWRAASSAARRRPIVAALVTRCSPDPLPGSTKGAGSTRISRMSFWRAARRCRPHAR